LNSINTLINDLNATQSAIDTFVQNNMQTILRVDKKKWQTQRTSLLSHIPNVEMFQDYPTDPNNKYTAESWQALTDAVDALDKLLAADNPSVTDLNNAADKLNYAALHLMPVASADQSQDNDSKSSISPVIIGVIVGVAIVLIGGGIFVMISITRRKTHSQIPTHTETKAEV